MCKIGDIIIVDEYKDNVSSTSTVPDGVFTVLFSLVVKSSWNITVLTVLGNLNFNCSLDSSEANSPDCSLLGRKSMSAPRRIFIAIILKIYISTVKMRFSLTL